MKPRMKWRVGVVHAEVLPVPPVLGGAIGQTIYDTVQQMPDVAWTVVSRWDEALSGREVDARFVYVDVDAHLAQVQQTLQDANAVIQTERELRRFCYVDGVVALLKERDLDVIQVHNRPQFLPYIKSRLPDKKFILFLHNEVKYSDRRVRQGIAQADRIVLVSRYLLKKLAQAFPQFRKKMTVIHNAVDPQFWHPKSKLHPQTQQIREQWGLKKGATVLFVGRTVPEKGLHCLIEAMPGVRNKIPKARLMVVGSPLFGAKSDSAYVQKLKRWTAQLGDGVVFTGFVDSEQLHYYYAASDVMVVPSLWAEPFGKVVIEAMAMALPVIASRRGGIPEIIKKERGGVLIDDPENVEVLTRQIVGFLTDCDRGVAVGDIGRKAVQKYFSFSVRHTKLLSLYETVIAT